MELEKYSMGVGDRFGCQGRAQLSAMIEARSAGVSVVPVWNKSHREHTIIGTSPADVRAEADAAVTALGWRDSYYVDADHIGLDTVDAFISASDFFTIDVADFTGVEAATGEIAAFVDRHADLCGQHQLPVIGEGMIISPDTLGAGAAKYLPAVKKAGEIYRHIANSKGEGAFVTEISMDETDSPQTPLQLLLILAAISDEGIPAQTIAPKFSGRFNKGVDYVGEIERFGQEFEQDLAVIRYAIEQFGLPRNLKLSVHSGSDKFSIYSPIREALIKFDAGLHLKTAGTTWLEELIGLASAGGDGLALACEIYASAFARYDEMCAPYRPVIDISREALPEPAEVARWSGIQFAAAVRHDLQCPAYNASFRQLLHVAYKVAAEMGTHYISTLLANEEAVAENVKANILQRHLLRIFPAGE